MIRFNPTTPVRFYAKESTYISGKGNTVSWKPIKSQDIEVFYCEWHGSYGTSLTAAQALGVDDSATLRAFYVPAIYEKLRTVQVVIIKNADTTALVNGVPDKNNPNTYELWGGVDNVSEGNQFIEFRVRRYEGK